MDGVSHTLMYTVTETPLRRRTYPLTPSLPPITLSQALTRQEDAASSTIYDIVIYITYYWVSASALTALALSSPLPFFLASSSLCSEHHPVNISFSPTPQLHPAHSVTKNLAAQGITVHEEPILWRTHSMENTFYREHILWRTHSIKASTSMENTFYGEDIL